MVLGMSLTTFTLFHVLLSVIGIFAGVVVLGGLFGGNKLPGWTSVFLITTVLTSVSGFFFPFTAFGPPHIVGVLSLVVLAAVIPALYVYHLSGAWRWVYVLGTVLSLYFNVFVAVVQAFQKLPYLQSVAPTQTEAPFIVTQSLVLLAFIAFGVLAVKLFHSPASPLS